MKYDFPEKSTEPLAGLYFKGTVQRRFLITYPVEPEVLLPWIPPRTEPCLHNGKAWLSACFVQMKAMRPSWLTAWMGLDFKYLVHRFMVRVPFPDGRIRDVVMVLEANVNRTLPSLFGRMVSGINFFKRDIELRENADEWRLLMGDADLNLFDVTIPKSGLGGQLPSGSIYPNVEEAERFLLDATLGGQWNPSAHQIRIHAETHQPWQCTATDCMTHSHELLLRLTGKQSRADHVLTMSGADHRYSFNRLDLHWPLRPVKTDKAPQPVRA